MKRSIIFLVFLLIAVPGFCVITPDQPTTLAYYDVTPPLLHDCEGTNRLLIVTIGAFDTVSVAPTYNGVTMTEVGSVVNDNGYRAYMYYLVNPAVGSHTVTYTLTGGDHSVTGATCYAGVDQSTPIGTPATGTNDTFTSVHATVSSAVGELVVDSMLSNATPTAGTGQTPPLYTVSGTTFYGGSSNKNGDSSVTMTWTFSSSYAAIIAVPLKPAAVTSAPHLLNLLGVGK